jgi:hypothetical protein
MVQSNFESKVRIQEIIDNQIPEFILEENPKFSEFLKQYYISQEYQGASVDIVENLVEYLKLDNLTPEVISGNTTLSQQITNTSDVIYVSSTTGFPNSYGLLQIDDEIITYKERLADRFAGCVRGFSGIKSYDSELVFSDTNSSSHVTGSKVTNLSVLFLQKFYEKIKFTFLPGLEKVDLYESLNVNNFIKNSKSFYQAKGTKESFRILFNALYGIEPTIVDLETFLFKSSAANYRRRKELLFENLSSDKDPLLLTGYQVIKNNNSNVFGSVSEAEIFTRNNNTYYKFYIFLGYDDSNLESSGEFQITPSSKVVEKITAASSSTVITVDSTIGFSNSGSLFFGGIEVFYTDKSINQFFGCYTKNSNYINANIEKTTIVYSNDTYFGYENGDKTKRVNLRLLGVVNNIEIKNQNESDYIFSEGDKIYIKHLGDLIKNPPSNKSNLQIIANSFIYNTSSRYELNEFDINSRTAFTLSDIDDSSLKEGDYVEFLERNTEILENSLSNVEITTINKQTGEIEFGSNLGSLNPLKDYDIRRKLKTSSSSIVPLQHQNITCDVTNVYSENDQNIYVASNSLPSYEITKNLFSYNASSLVNFNNDEQKYTSIRFNSEVSFLSGDRVYYSYSGSSIVGLSEGLYYITVSSDKKEIKLFVSRSFISIDKFVYLESIPSGTHTFTLLSQKTEDGKVYPQKLLKKVESDVDSFYDEKDPIGTETIGILVNGVEIFSPNSIDKIYYGPLDTVQIINPGENYDVINLPVLELSSGNAKLQPVVQGSIERVHIDPQEFNIERPLTLSVSGGNGKGAILSPITKLKSREVFFDARILEEGGGLSITSETITFLTNHNFFNGQKVIYDINNINNQKIGIGTFEGSNIDSGRYLGNNSIFYAKVINSKTIQIYPTYGDYVSGINTVGFTTVGNFGIHKFKTEPKKVLDSIRVNDGGTGFTNRKLIVNPSGISTYNPGISTYNHTINFNNHGFSSGELVTYDKQTTSIVGLSTSNQYYVLKVDENSFRVCNAGVGGTDNQNYLRQNYVKFTSTGSGYQYFNYPNITVDVSYTLADGQTIKSITATPVVRGSIIQTYLYEKGSNYGSNILNLENVPDVRILDGQFAQLTPVISAGRIVNVLVSYYGSDYYSVPDIVVESKSGSGAIFRANINRTNGRLESVTILNEGYSYNPDDTTLKVVTTGKNAVFFPKIRELTLDNCYKYGTQYQNYRDQSYEILYKTKNNTLQYAVTGYSELLKSLFNESTTNHSPIIGWSYDGIPIYGPFGYLDPDNSSSQIKLMESGYSLVEVENRVSTIDFPLGYFIDDYKFTNSGDLDEYNGRFCKTPEYPNGVYAYFATAQLNPENNYIGVFPYFVGKYYRSKIISENINPNFNQKFDFNSSNLLRNTLPYKSGQKYGKNDFIPNYFGQICEVNSTLSGNVQQVEVTSAGNNYKVGDLLYFNSDGTSGYGLECSVESVKGKELSSIQSTVKKYENAKLYTSSSNEFYVKYLPNFDVSNNSKVTITGLTSSFANLNGQHNVFIEEFNTKLINSIPFGATGIVTDLYLQDFPKRVSIGSSIKIVGATYDEYFSILNHFNDIGVLRVVRTSSSGLSTSNSPVSFLPDVLKIQAKSNNSTQLENYLRYFNPNNSIGVGTFSGSFTSKSFYNGSELVTIPIPTQSIYLPDHGFRTNQKVILKRPSGTTAIQVSNDGNVSFQILSGGETERELFAINKSKDYIGIVTSVGLTTSTNGLYFTGAVGSNNYQYSFESVFDEFLCNVVDVKSTVSVSTSHNLSLNDNVDIDVRPNKSVGVGGSSFINLKYIDSIKSITTKLLSFTPTEVNSTTSKINFVNHGLISGDKVYYISTSVIGGLSTGTYYVHKIDSNSIHLCETYIDSTSPPTNFIKFTSVGIGTQELNLIQPKIDIIRNNDLVFNVSDSSLEGYEFKLYTNSELTKEFVSVASTGDFSLVGVNTIGISTDARITLKYSNNYPEKLYYTLEKDNEIIELNDTVKNSSEINFINSFYSGKYNIFNVTNTTFDINLREVPEESSYNDTDCDILSYATNSLTAIGEVNKVNIISSGINYKDIPNYTSSSSTNGNGLNILPSSTNIGKINGISIKNSGFEYSNDKTLSPNADISKNVKIKTSNTLTRVNVIDGGKKYPSAPNLVVVDSDTGEKINSGLLRATMSGGGLGNSNIQRVTIEIPVNGLPSTPVTIKAVDNSNGIIIDRIESSRSGILTCLIKTPILGFVNDPFAVNDEVFLENIEITPNSGIGFDSENHGYQFFKVTGYTPNSNPGRVVIQIPELYGDPGIAVTFQINTFASIIKKSNYPFFSVDQDYSLFELGEQIAVVSDPENIIITDLIVERSRENYLKLSGDYELVTGDIIKGFSSSYLATIESISSSNGVFIVGTENFVSLDWEDETGKTSNDSQFLPDNDYYQNLSYTIKTEKTWDQISSIVNSMVHPIGTKNFADTQISSSTSGIVSTGLVPSSQLDSIQSFISQSRTDIIKNLDFVKDYDTISNVSRIIRFKNLKLTDYVEALSNRVLQIDDISSEFSSSDDNETRLNQIILALPKDLSYGKFLIQIKSTNQSLVEDSVNEIQFTEIISLKNNDDAFFLEKSTISNLYGVSSDSNVFGTKIADIIPVVDDVKNYYFLFTPTNPYDIDYEIKILGSRFLTTLESDSSLTIGSSDIFNTVNVVEPQINENILSLDSSLYTSFYSQIHVLNKTTFEMNYVEIYATYDGNDVYFSDYYFDGTEKNDFSYGFIGSFGLSHSGGLLNLNYLNESNINNITIRTKTICFNDTSSGIGTYRFKSTRQADGSERTIILDSGTTAVSTSSTIFSYDTDLFSSIKSLVKVSIGATSSLHQLMTIHDNNNSIITEYPILLVNNNLGIGTFSSFVDENKFEVIFTPNAEFNGQSINIQYYNESFYTLLDEINIPQPLSLTPLYENLNIAKYFGLNSNNINRLNFKLRYRSIPVFAKTFDPFDTSILNPSTGTFTIDNHFFSTGEKLIYTPKSTFIGLGQSAMGIPSGSITDAGISTNRLPSSVYAIKISNSQFQIALTQSNANSGTAVTFTYLGEGNAHMFEMYKKNEKSLITINNLAQYPLTFTGIAHSLSGNDGQIGVGITFFTLSGISSIKPTDLLKIDNEYMKVLNVGIGTSSSGPILFFTGDKNIVEVERGFVGSSATSHLDNSQVQIYRGSYNISEDEIYFTQPPRGNIFDLVQKDERNLERSRASFSARVFLRKDYSTNVIFDDISSQFTGIGETFLLKSQGINTVGLGTTSGNGILFINGIYQTPFTQNVTDFNFRIVENPSSGISSVVFTGIRNDNDEITISESDVNKNQLPRGGIIVSLGSTEGVGYAPLVGAKVKATLDVNGSITDIVGIATTGSPVAFTTATYNNETGILNVFAPSTNNLIGANQVKLVGLAFTCPSNPGIVSYFPSHDQSLNIIGVGTTSFSVQVGTSTLPHYYVGYGTIFPWYEDLNFGSGYRQPISIAVTESGHVGDLATISATVGAGGTLSFVVGAGGTGYSNPIIQVSPPSYQNLPIVGVSRLGIGETTDTGIGLLMNVEIGSAVGIDTLGNVGIGSTLFQVSSFKITRTGYNFRRGDIFKPVGLVTAKGYNQPINEFRLAVLETYNDNFAAWQFGELNLMDSIIRFQDGSRLNYPLYYEGQLLSFQTNVDDPDSQVIDFDSLLVIFVNGILQEPKIAYEFNGGSSVRFLTAPKVDDNVEIYFYIGTRGVDSQQVNVDPFIQVGDNIQIYSNNGNLENTVTQNTRIVFDLISSDLMETNLYFEQGVDEQNEKPLYWIKQKEDIIINDIIYSKSRDSLEPQVYPTGKIIKDFSISDTEVFVDNASFFDYEEELPTEKINLLIIPSNESIEVGIITAVVSTSGTIQSLSIVNGGIGYTGSTASIKISNPYYGIGVGVGTTATASLTISGGSITNAVIVNSGFGYTNTNPPQVIVEYPTIEYEECLNANVVNGFDGVITGIGTTSGIGVDLAIQFTIFNSDADYSDLLVGYPIYIFDTQVGTGLTSIDQNENDIIGVSTSTLDDIYYVHGKYLSGTSGIITCNISNTTNIVGIATTGTVPNPIGKFSWGKISGFSRSSNPVSIGISGYEVNPGLSSYPTVQRRGYGLRNTGALKKDLTT